MSGKIGSYVVLDDDGVAFGLWGPFVLKSAFQPIFAFETGKLAAVAFEALLRPFRDGKSVAPPTFLGSLPAAERIVVENLIHRLHLTNAAACLPHPAAVYLNFDPSVFTDHAVVATALRDMRVTLSEVGMDPRRIVCEVTEKETVTQDVLFSLVASLRESGFAIAVDDYGADESDMARIRDLRPDIVKFDAKWATRLMDSGPGYALLATMVSTFAGQGIRTILEGIEEGWQLELAEKAGAEMVQGFALARPELAPTSFGGSSWAMSSQPSGQAPVTRIAAGEDRHARTFGRRTQPQ